MAYAADLKSAGDSRVGSSPTSGTTANAATRFFSFVRVNPATGCHEWTGALDRSGYGAFKHNGKKINSHRWNYQFSVGDIPKGLDLDHLCRVRKCVRVAHLEPVTRRVNVIRGVSGIERATACIHGHPYTPENTYRAPRGHRECRTCKYRGGRRDPIVGR